jgi:hypothetical protein
MLDFQTMPQQTKLDKEKCDCCRKVKNGSMIYIGGEPIEFLCCDCNPAMYKRTYKEHFVELAEQQEQENETRWKKNGLTLSR